MTSPADDPRERERELMVQEQLAARGVRSPAVLAALGRVPRHGFLPPALQDRAYADNALPIDCQQTISQPYMVARMTELLELERDARVLEIGTGSGYQTAILARLAGRVFTIEWHLRLMTQAAERLAELGLHNVAFRCGDGSLGGTEQAPFDASSVTAGAPDVPEPLKEQLTVGGRLVVPTGPVEDQLLVRVRRVETGFANEDVIRCRFVKLLGRAGWRE